jgi:predicted TIM-barrel fold metal-dependent hydrolase
VPGNGPPLTVVDAHAHIFSPEVVEGRAAYLGREPWFEQLYTNPNARLASAADILESMTAAGIACSVVCGFPWKDLGLCRAHNDYLAEASRDSGGALAWLGIVPPGGGDAAAREADRVFSLGALGLGELNADAQGFDLKEAAGFAAVAEVCQAVGRPVMLHASEPVGHAYPGKGTATPEKILSFVSHFPKLPIVLAHWGGGLPFYELMPEVRATLRNVVYDCSASTYLYRFDIFPVAAGIVGAERVLFGSDYPVLGQARFLRRVLDAGLEPAALPAILSENTQRVYHLPALVVEEGPLS